ncbi:MAG: M48 family metallopeptidase [Pseudomonadota bacterium]
MNRQMEGQLYDADSTVSRHAVLTATDGRVSIQTDEGVVITEAIADLSVSPRIGNIERKLTLGNGAVFATADNDGVDRIVAAAKSGSGFLHRIESNLGWVAVSLVVTVISVFAFGKWGIPAVSEAVANALPHKTNEIISAGAMDLLDRVVFEPSTLDTATQDQIRQRFFDTLVPLEQEATDIEYELLFRQWPLDDGESDTEHGIPNALALPSGQIVVTDQFVRLATSPDEIDAVLLHEMGHVVERHGLQMAVQGAIVAGIVVVVVGDAGALADMGVGLGSLLISSHYSRGHESEADRYAFGKMLKSGIDPRAFGRILSAMESYMRDIERGDEPTVVDDPDPNVMDDGDQDTSSVLDYLRSHPSTEERVRLAERYAQCFDRRLIDCS